MTKDDLHEALHREMLFYCFAQREPRLEIRAGESLISAVWRKMQPYADCGFPRPITETDIEMLYNCSTLSTTTLPTSRLSKSCINRSRLASLSSLSCAPICSRSFATDGLCSGQELQTWCYITCLSTASSA